MSDLILELRRMAAISRKMVDEWSPRVKENNDEPQTIESMTDDDLFAWDHDADVAENESAFMYMEVQDYRKLRERLRLAEEAGATWKSWAEQRAIEVEGALNGLNTWKKVALERQSIKADYARLWYELRNFLSAFDAYSDRAEGFLIASLQEIADAKQAMFSAAIQAREALERAVTRPDGTTSGRTPGPASPDDSASSAREEEK